LGGSFLTRSREEQVDIEETCSKKKTIQGRINLTFKGLCVNLIGIKTWGARESEGEGSPIDQGESNYQAWREKIGKKRGCRGKRETDPKKIEEREAKPREVTRQRAATNLLQRVKRCKQGSEPGKSGGKKTDDRNKVSGVTIRSTEGVPRRRTRRSREEERKGAGN